MMQPLLSKFTSSPPHQTQLQRQRQRPTQPRPQSCLPPTPLGNPTIRTSITDNSITISAWPSRGCVIILPSATALDFTFLNPSHLDPPLRRDSNQASEDDFCKQLLLLGAQWWDSPSRHRFVSRVSSYEPLAIADLEEEREPSPTLRERRWVKVGWPTEPKGGLWVAGFDPTWYDIQEEENLVPEDGGRVALARDMDERCKIIERIGGVFFENLEEYVGEAFLRAWEWEREGEVGALMKTG